MGNNKFIEYTERNDDLGIPQVVQGMAVRELSDLELVIISASGSLEFEYVNIYETLGQKSNLPLKLSVL